MTQPDMAARRREWRLIAALVITFVAGLSIGARLFMNTQPRSWLNVGSCEKRCYRTIDLMGLLASAGVVNLPGLVPQVLRETDKCLAVAYPSGGRQLHLVFFPKRDVRDIADLTPEDVPYVMDCFAMIREVIHEKKLWDYRVYTNGPGEQDISYLHFHLVVW